MNNLIYNINEAPKRLKEWILYSMQQVLAVFVATTLISLICGTPVSSCLLGAGIGTLVYQVITKFKSPIFISSCGATVSAVCGALALNAAGNNYLMVACGGLVICMVYTIFALIVKRAGTAVFNKIFPATIVGAVTMVIGINLAGFILGYVGQTSTYAATKEIIVAIVTMLIVAVTSHYGKGFIKNIPFLIGIAGGYLLSLCLGLVSFDAFSSMTWYPDVTFLKWSASDWSWSNLGKTVLMFLPVAICALLEHYSDHKVLSNIIGTDLTEDPGLQRTLFGDGVASAIGTAVCGLPNTSYGESIATIGFSKVASVKVISVSSIILIAMSFLGPVQAFVQSIPSCVFGGCAMILYGYIAASGLKTLINSKVDLEDNKNLVVVSVILTVGVCGIFFGTSALTGVSLAMVLGVILNCILRSKTKKSD